MNLLVVDDEYFARRGIIDGVNWDVLPYDQVFEAGSMQEAVDLFAKEKIEVLLCDIEMPNGNGLELVSWVNQNRNDTICIILSCHDEFGFAQQAVKLKCMDYILKPADPNLLTQTLKTAAEQVKDNEAEALFQNYGKLYVDNLARSAGAETPNAVEKVVKYIDEHLEDDLGVKMLADMVYVSPDHLSRLFKKKMRLSIKDYILQKRMVLAGELLKDSHLTVTIVSNMVGFVNYSYFADQFKKYYGVTPKKYQMMQEDGTWEK